MPVKFTRRGPETGWKTPKEVSRTGKRFLINGRMVELFPIRVLAEAIERTTTCIRDWEREGLFPKTMFAVVAGGGNKAGSKQAMRWYSAEQIVNVNALYRALKGERNGGNRKWSSGFSVNDFLTRCREVFYRVDVRVDPETGELIPQLPVAKEG